MIFEFKDPGRRKKNKTKLIREMRAIEEMVIDFHDSYEETRVVLLPVGPYLVHVYWNIAPKDLKRARKRLREKDLPAQATLRFYDITYIIFDGCNAHNSFDIDININAGNWYVHLWSPEKSYCADLGLKTGDSQFFQIVRSNVAEIPPACPSEKREERYMLVLGDYKRVEIIPQMPEMSPAMQPECSHSQEAKTGIEGKPPSCSFRELYESFESENMDKTCMSQGHIEDDENRWKQGRTWVPGFSLGRELRLKPNTQQAFSHEVLKRKLAELYRFRLAKIPGPKLKSLHNFRFAQCKHCPRARGGVADLTEMNERGLPVGISSRVIIP